MAKGIIISYSRSGHTKEMAEILAKSMNEADLPTDCKSVEKVKADDLLNNCLRCVSKCPQKALDFKRL